MEELSQLSKSVAEQRNERIKRRINRSNDIEKKQKPPLPPPQNERHAEIRPCRTGTVPAV